MTLDHEQADNRYVFDTRVARRVCDRATAAPWRQGSVERDRIFVQHRGGLGPERVLLRMNEHFEANVDDAAFIAYAREALPAACDRVEELLQTIVDVAQTMNEEREQRYRKRVETLENALSELIDDVVSHVPSRMFPERDVRLLDLRRLLHEKLDP